MCSRWEQMWVSWHRPLHQAPAVVCRAELTLGTDPTSPPHFLPWVQRSWSDSKCHYSISKAQQTNHLIALHQRDEALVDTCRTAQNACFPLYPAPLIPNPLPCRVVSSAIEFPLSRPGCTRWLVTEQMISSHMQHLAMARSALKIAGLQSS